MNNLYIIANWKMNKTIKETEDFFEKFLDLYNKKQKNVVVVCPSFLSIQKSAQMVEGKNVFIGAQNVYFEESGVYTGEVSTNMLKEVGATYVIIGHSSRREFQKESNDLINKKLMACIESGLTPILCVGENKKEKELDRTYKVIKKQIIEAFDDIVDPSKVIVAYEPLWAISDGKSPAPIPTIDEISKASSGIRRVLKQMYDQGKIKNLKVLYGGSVTPNNAKEIMSIKNINGVLVGGASLNPDKFNGIIKAVE